MNQQNYGYGGFQPPSGPPPAFPQGNYPPPGNFPPGNYQGNYPPGVFNAPQGPPPGFQSNFQPLSGPPSGQLQYGHGGFNDQSQGYSQPQQFQQQMASPPAPQTPQTYLGVPIHPSENNLLSHVPQPGAAVDGYDPTFDVTNVRKATKGFGTKETLLTKTLAPLAAVRFPVLNQAYVAAHRKDLVSLIKSETSGNYETVLVRLVQGPLIGDVEFFQTASAGIGTKEHVLTEILIGRPPSSVDLLRAAYQKKYPKTTLDKMVDGELSMGTLNVFNLALSGIWKDLPNNGKGDINFVAFPPPVNDGMVEADFQTISKLKSTKLQDTVLAQVLFQRSPVHLNRLQHMYKQRVGNALTKDIKRQYSGHMKDAFLYAAEGGKRDVNGCYRDAKHLHKAMEGFGTKDNDLIMRLLRAHWDKPRFQMVQQAYQAKYKQSLLERVKKETSGDYREALVALF